MSDAQPLGSAQAAEIVELANSMYPPRFAQTREQVVRNLETARKAQCSLSYGLYEADQLVGYLLAWVENTRIEGRREPVITVDDVCVRPQARGRLFALFSALRQGIDEGQWGRLAIESAARSQAENLYLEHPRVIERLGFRLTHRARYYSDAIGEELTWMRYTPISSVDAVSSTDGLELSAELLDDPTAEPDEGSNISEIFRSHPEPERALD